MNERNDLSFLTLSRPSFPSCLCQSKICKVAHGSERVKALSQFKKAEDESDVMAFRILFIKE